MSARPGETGFHADGTVDVQCHCGTAIVAVPVATMAGGGTCGKADCVLGCPIGPASSGGRPRGRKDSKPRRRRSAA